MCLVVDVVVAAAQAPPRIQSHRFVASAVHVPLPRVVPFPKFLLLAIRLRNGHIQNICFCEGGNLMIKCISNVHVINEQNSPSLCNSSVTSSNNAANSSCVILYSSSVCFTSSTSVKLLSILSPCDFLVGTLPSNG